MAQIYQVRVTGFEPIRADSPEEALDIMECRFVACGYTIRDLRWKSISISAAGGADDEKLALIKKVKELEDKIEELKLYWEIKG